MMNTTRTLVVVSGGLSEESTTHRLADGLTRSVVALAQRRGFDVVVRRIDVRELAQELVAASLSGFVSGRLAQAYAYLDSADAVVAVSPTYKAGYTGLFKAFWDVTADGVLAGVPVIVGATGGTPRHSLVLDTAMRPLFAYMKALTMPTGVYAATDDWAGRNLHTRIEEAAGELVAQWVGAVDMEPRVDDGSTADPGPSSESVRTLSGTRSQARDPFGDVPTMEQLLG